MSTGDAVVRVHHDRIGNTLTVWFDDPASEVVCEEADHDVILIKDCQGQIIGFERLNCRIPVTEVQELGDRSRQTALMSIAACPSRRRSVDR
jgi:hypothetical protein